MRNGLLALAALLVFSCVEQGPAGPVGPTGTPGAPGAPGTGGTGTSDPNLQVLSAAFPTLNLYRNLLISNAADSPVAANADFEVQISASTLQVGSQLLQSLNLTADLDRNGAGGLDTGSPAAATWYAVFVITSSTTPAVITSAGLTGQAAGLLSTSLTPTMPAGFKGQRRVGWMRTGESVATFYRIRQTDRLVHYLPEVPTGESADPSRVLISNAAIGTTVVQVNTTAHFPPGVGEVFVKTFMSTGTTEAGAAEGDFALFWAQSSGTAGRFLTQCFGETGAVAVCMNDAWVTLGPGQAFFVGANVVSSEVETIQAEGYLDETL
jgi:hypothetical protein